MNKSVYILIFVFFISLTANDNLQKQYDYANQLFVNHNYYEAITEFKRIQFFDKEKLFTFEINYKIGVAYKKGGYYKNAIEYLTKAKIAANDQSKIIEAEFQIIRANILRNTFDRAFQLLNELQTKLVDTSYQKEIYYWCGWANMLSDNWEAAAQNFAKISKNHELKLLCEQVTEDKYSVTFARVISYILPGVGQFYTGNYFAGIMSLSWNALWGFLTVNAFIEDRAFDGAAIGSLLWLRFYRGNIQNAENLAETENIEIANKALLYLMETYKGEKP